MIGIATAVSLSVLGQDATLPRWAEPRMSEAEASPRERSDLLFHARLRIVNLRSRLAGPFDFDLGAGECLAVTGPSGAGKSLFLRMFAVLDPNEGEVFLDGIERRTITAPAWRRQVVYGAAEPGWWSERIADHFHGADMAFARFLAPRLALAPTLLEGPVVQLSTGERQRMALMRSLAVNSTVLLLDEPTGALDEETTKLVEQVLRERLAAGVTIAMVTHSVAQAARLGHRHLRMEDRRLVQA
jgi:ABC-type iron transport system FetAB ATPase subunit